MPQIPGAEVFQVLAQAPIDAMNLASQHASEVMNFANMGAQQVAASLSLPALPMDMPELPGMSGMMPTAAPNTVTAASVGATPAVYSKVKPRLII